MTATMAGWSPNGKGNGRIYIGHGEVVATRTPKIAIPLPRGDPSPHNEGGDQERTTFANFIWVDFILTGGYAAAAVKAAHPAINKGGAHPGDDARSTGATAAAARRPRFLRRGGSWVAAAALA
jgi:hypothetical protein